MSTKSSKFLIGLFVIVGLLILAATIIWVGASRVLMKGSLYAAYFDESVQGLQVDSAIKYRGVEIGKVQSIDVAPDYRLVEVIMKIDLEGDLQHHTIASLKTAGITGIVFIELDRIQDDELSNSPKLTFKSDYPVIPSRRSEISRFLSRAGRDRRHQLRVSSSGGIRRGQQRQNGHGGPHFPRGTPPCPR